MNGAQLRDWVLQAVVFTIVGFVVAKMLQRVTA